MTSMNFHCVCKIKAEAGPTKGAPLSITATDHKGHAMEVTLFVDDHALAIRLAAAINSAVENHRASLASANAA